VLGARCTIAAFAIVHGGAELDAGVRVEDHVIVGQPERGYAVRNIYPGAGAPPTIGAGAVLRAGAVLYAGVSVGAESVVGHHTLLRSHVRVGQRSQLGHHLTVERAASLGEWVRCSPGSHITSETVIEDDVFLGAGVRTINDNGLIWHPGQPQPPLTPPRFARGCKVGSGSAVLGGVVIGEAALIGAGSVVTRDVPARALAYGNPATVRGTTTGGQP